MIKKYMSNLFVLSLSLLFSPAWAGKVFFKDGREVEVPEGISIRHNVYELGDIFLEVEHQETLEKTEKGKEELLKHEITKVMPVVSGFYLKFNQGGTWAVNKTYDCEGKKIEQLLLRIRKHETSDDKEKEFSLTYPTYTYADGGGHGHKSSQYYETFYYKLSDIVENKLDANGFTVQDK